MGIFDSVTRTIAFLVTLITAYSAYVNWGDSSSIAWLVATAGWVPHVFKD